MKKTISTFAISFTAILLLAAIPTFVTDFGIGDWYKSLNKPDFQPPASLFGPVWMVLYLLMAVTFTILYLSQHKGRVLAMVIFGIQFVLNILWSILFFSMHNLTGALLEIAILWVLIVITIISCYKVNKAAGLLQIPYLLWVSFATVLTYSIWLLNT